MTRVEFCAAFVGGAASAALFTALFVVFARALQAELRGDPLPTSKELTR